MINILKKIPALFAFFLSAGCLYEYQFNGFPDGYANEWVKLRSLVLILAFLYNFSSGVAWLIFFRRFANFRQGLLGFFVYLIIALAIFWIDFKIVLVSGRGG